MRTTLDIDDDVLHAAKEIARRERRTARAVISELTRKALTTPPATRDRKAAHGFQQFPAPGKGGHQRPHRRASRGRRPLTRALLCSGDRTRIHGPRQVTDLYLLALGVRNRGRFVTFDAGIPLAAVRGAERRHVVAL